MAQSTTSGQGNDEISSAQSSAQINQLHYPQPRGYSWHRLQFTTVHDGHTYDTWLQNESKMFSIRYHRALDQQHGQNYSVIGFLGKGALGNVLLVRSKNTAILYAMKTMDKQKVIENKMVASVIHECKLLAAVHHPLLLYLCDRQKDCTNLYIITPFIEYGDLYHLMASRKMKRFTNDEAVFFMAQVCLALEYMHSIRLLYRDLKPENLMLGCDGYLRLVDFGFSKLLHSDVERTYSRLGTIEYMAPEIFSMNCGYSYSIDWWAAGCLLYEMLNGSPPFKMAVENPSDIVNQISFSNINYPEYMNTLAINLIQGLCVKNPSMRLGCQKFGAKAVKDHHFFAHIDFIAVFRKSLHPQIDPSKNKTKPFHAFKAPSNPLRLGDVMEYEAEFERF